MKRIKLLRTTLAAAIVMASLMTLTGCFWGHDHHDDRDYHEDHHDDHQDDHH